MGLEATLAERLAQVITEQRQRHRLQEFGLRPLRKLLLVGPPGTGKTMTAAALAGELALPLFSTQLPPQSAKLSHGPVRPRGLIDDQCHDRLLTRESGS
jgi:SpoVK/Ycf46/Vps4 family AAA+-type ATPase